jgi:hypothetical protein
MGTNRVLKGVLLLVGVLILCCVHYDYGLTHPSRTKTRALRIGPVNAAPRVVMSMTSSNTTVPTNAFPSTGE